MIDYFKRVAQAIQMLRLPSLWVGLISLASLVVMVLFGPSDKGSLLIIPCIVGWLWGMSAYAFIVTFRAVPEKPTAPLKFFGKLKHAMTRTWYGLISVIVLGATLAMIVITVRMISIWFRDYGG